jgi:uncharacterized membrane protein (DUF485 family)
MNPNTADIITHATGVANIIVCLILTTIAILRYKEVASSERKRIDILYAVIGLAYVIFLVLSLFHTWLNNPILGNTISKALNILFLTVVCVDLINRHKRGEC